AGGGVGGGAGMEALPLTERLEAPCASATPGVMHACGHDGHTAIGITLAEILAARRADMRGTAVFVFQPAEEVIGGAELMLAAGELDEPHVDEVYGMHLTTLTRVGDVHGRPGPAMASCDTAAVHLIRLGCHRANPHQLD